VYSALTPALAAIAWLAATGGATPQTVTVRLSSFAFTPEHLHLHAGVPVRLHFVNASNGGHNFTSPALFASGVFLAGAPTPDGSIEVPGGQTRGIVFLPRVPGTYEVRCTHFLHALFGMTGKVTVEGPAG
jgi:plastocyanin